MMARSRFFALALLMAMATAVAAASTVISAQLEMRVP